MKDFSTGKCIVGTHYSCNQLTNILKYEGQLCHNQLKLFKKQSP